MLSDRDKATSRVMRTLARIQLQCSLPVRLADGRSPVVLALPHDKFSSVVEQVAQYGDANVAVAYDDHIALLSFTRESMPTAGERAFQISRQSDIDMFIQYLKTQANKQTSVKVGGSAIPEVASPLQELEYAF